MALNHDIKEMAGETSAADMRCLKILLVGNYPNLAQYSMQLYAGMLQKALASEGHDVKLCRPPVVFGRMLAGDTGLAKWLGYFDRLILFPLVLRYVRQWADIVHVCDQSNAMYLAHVANKPHVLTCHDMFAIRAAQGEIPERRVGQSGRVLQRWLLRWMREAKMVVCVTSQTRDELLSITGKPAARTCVIPNALNYAYRRMPFSEAQPVLQLAGLAPGSSYFLHVGGNNWYKNKLGVVELYSELVKTPQFCGYKLIMAGKKWPKELRDAVGRLPNEHQPIEIEDPSNQQLCALYSSAEALLFPSLQEGFGWPILEAQACGCLVVTSNRQPMIEVSGGAAILIDPTAPSRGAAAIVESWTTRHQLIAQGYKNTERYQIHSIVGKYVDIYREVLMSFARSHTASGRRSPQ